MAAARAESVVGVKCCTMKSRKSRLNSVVEAPQNVHGRAHHSASSSSQKLPVLVFLLLLLLLLLFLLLFLLGLFLRDFDLLEDLVFFLPSQSNRSAKRYVSPNPASSPTLPVVLPLLPLLLMLLLLKAWVCAKNLSLETKNDSWNPSLRKLEWRVYGRNTPGNWSNGPILVRRGSSVQMSCLRAALPDGLRTGRRCLQEASTGHCIRSEE